MNKLFALLGSVTALGLSVPANAAIISIVNVPPTAVLFTFGDTAIFGASPTGAFDDTYTFTVPYNGLASLSLSTSSTTVGGVVTFTNIKLNNVSYPGAFSANGISGIPLPGVVQSVIELIGSTAGNAGTFSGTLTYTAGPVPEPATWATFLLGFGLLGLGLRRRPASHLVAH